MTPYQKQQQQQNQYQTSSSSTKRMTWLSRKRKSNQQSQLTTSPTKFVSTATAPATTAELDHTTTDHSPPPTSCFALMYQHHEADDNSTAVSCTRQHSSSRIISATLCKYFGLGTTTQSNLVTNIVNSTGIGNNNNEQECEEIENQSSSQVVMNDFDNSSSTTKTSIQEQQGLPDLVMMNSSPRKSSVSLSANVQLQELIACGRFGSVWRGTLPVTDGSESPVGDAVSPPPSVAVKVFSPQHKAHFDNELEIYSLFSQACQACDAVPVFYGAQKVYDEENGSRLDNNNHQTEVADSDTDAVVASPKSYHLVIGYAAGGNLQDFLAANTVSWPALCKILSDITRGLSFLHSELGKISVVHRDLTSRNILISSSNSSSSLLDLSCMICDFGFALKLSGCPTSECTSLPEVGTLRYMAPEVLDGAVNLRDCESALKQVDIYSLGLVFWEAASRCSDLYQGVPVPGYQLPYARELGNRLSFEKLRVLVAIHRARPLFPDIWKDTNPAIRLLKETIEYCWDHDAEARLTAPCVLRRVAQLEELWQCHKSQTLAALLKNTSANPIVRQQALAVISKKNSDYIYKSIGSHVNNFKDCPDKVVGVSEEKENQGPTATTTAAKAINELIQPPIVTPTAPVAADRQPKLSLPLQPHQGLNPCAERNFHAESVEDIRVLEESLVYETAKFKKGPETAEEPPELKNNIIRSQRAANPPGPPPMTQAQAAAHARYADSTRAYVPAHYPLPRVQNRITRLKLSNLSANMPEGTAAMVPDALQSEYTDSVGVQSSQPTIGNVSGRKRKPTHLPQRAARWAKSFVMRTFKLHGVSLDESAVLGGGTDSDSTVQIVYPSSISRSSRLPPATLSTYNSSQPASISPATQHHGHPRRHLSLPHGQHHGMEVDHRLPILPPARANSVQSHYSASSSNSSSYSASPPSSPLPIHSDTEGDGGLDDSYELMTPCMIHQAQEDEEEEERRDNGRQRAETLHKDLLSSIDTIPLN